MHDIKFIKDNSSLFDEILKKEIFPLPQRQYFIVSELFRKLKKTQNLQEKIFF